MSLGVFHFTSNFSRSDKYETSLVYTYPTYDKTHLFGSSFLGPLPPGGALSCFQEPHRRKETPAFFISYIRRAHTTESMHVW
jgi:hypothetical protein